MCSKTNGDETLAQQCTTVQWRRVIGTMQPVLAQKSLKWYFNSGRVSAICPWLIHSQLTSWIQILAFSRHCRRQAGDLNRCVLLWKTIEEGVVKRCRPSTCRFHWNTSTERPYKGNNYFSTFQLPNANWTKAVNIIKKVLLTNYRKLFKWVPVKFEN